MRNTKSVLMKHNLRSFFTQTLLASLTLGAAPFAQANGLGLSSSLNLLSFGNFTAPSADIEGQVAVGGNASLTGYTINSVFPYTQPLYSGTALTVGGNLNYSGGSVFGNTVVGGSLTVPVAATFHGSVQVAGNLNTGTGWLSATSASYGGTSNLPISLATKVDPLNIQPGINFAVEQQRLTSLSQSFDALANSGLNYRVGGELILNANHADVAVFDLYSADMTNIWGMRLDNFGPNTTVILNVHGESVNFTAGSYQNFTAGHVLFNLPGATEINFISGVYASFLAPLAEFNTPNGAAIGGQVVVGSWNGIGQVNNNPFVSAVPEPETYAMLLAGLAIIGSVVRRRRAG